MISFLWSQNSPIAKKLFLGIVLMSSALTLVFTALQILEEYYEEVGQIEREVGDLESPFVVRAMTAALWTLDELELKGLIEGIKNRPYVTFVKLEGPDTYSFELGNKTRHASIWKEIPLVQDLGGGERQYLGKLIVQSSFDGVMQRLYKRIWILLLGNAVKTFLMALFFVFLFNRLVQWRLNVLREYAQSIHLGAEGVKSENRPLTHEQNEFTPVFLSMEKMVHSLNVTMRQLQDKERYLQHAQKMQSVGVLASSLAHDFRNLLSIVQLNVFFLKADFENNIVPDKHIQNAFDAIRQGDELITNLTRFARKGTGEAKPVLFDEFVRRNIELIRHALRQEIQIRESLNAPGVQVLLDTGELLNACVNLAVNARDAIPAEGYITLHTRQVQLDEGHGPVPTGAYLVFDFGDSGAGISPEFQKKIFDPFFTTKPEGKGTGLGLSQVYNFVMHSAGHITLQSEIGQGAVFSLWFPVYTGVDS